MILIPKRPALAPFAAHRPADLYAQSLGLLLCFGEGGGTQLHDSAAGVIATYNGAAPVWTASPYGPAVSLNGSNNYISVPASKLVDSAGGFAMACWFYFQATSESYNAIYSNEDGNAGSGQTMLIRSADSKLAWYVSGDGQDPIGSAIPTNVWTHIACSYGPNIHCRAFVNGVNIHDHLNSTFTPFTTSHILNIGGHTPFGAGRYIQGKIASFALWSRPLADAEIIRLYQGSR
jgi:hypothetical protein